MIVLDTNVLSELMRPVPSATVVQWIEKQSRLELFTTTITEAEIFYGIELLAPGKRRDKLLLAAEAMFARDLDGRILSFDSLSARNFAPIAARRRIAGKPMSHADAQIAAIAKMHGAAIATHNTSDFDNCGVRIIDPWVA